MDGLSDVKVSRIMCREGLPYQNRSELSSTAGTTIIYHDIEIDIELRIYGKKRKNV